MAVFTDLAPHRAIVVVLRDIPPIPRYPIRSVIPVLPASFKQAVVIVDVSCIHPVCGSENS